MDNPFSAFRYNYSGTFNKKNKGILSKIIYVLFLRSNLALVFWILIDSQR